MLFDFTALRAQLLHSAPPAPNSSCATAATQAVEACIAAAHSPACQHAYLHTDAAGALQAAAGAASRPLAGVAVSVKALFDVQGWVTHAGSAVLRHAAPATTDALAVARLRAAGACILGQTHMVEFAFSGVGTNPHDPTPAAIDGLWQQTLNAHYVPGGSSSGCAVSVAGGGAWIGLGSDTGGSIRIPAALNGLVGFKSTADLVPLQGSIPLSASLDTACAMTHSVRDAITAHSILAARRVTRSSAPLSAWRLAVPRTLMLDDLQPAVAHSFARSLHLLRQAGAHIEDIDLPELLELADINAAGGLTAAESFAWHRPLLHAHATAYDPRVRIRIERGSSILAADYLATQQARTNWIARMQQRLRGYDALLSPTTPITAPLLSSVAPASGTADDAARDAAFFQANALLLRNTSVVNMLDGCALSIPCHLPGELPMGLMLWHGNGHDDAILHLGLQAEAALLHHAIAQGAQRRTYPIH